MECPECGSSDIIENGRTERSERGPDGDWYEYQPCKCEECGYKWEHIRKCSDSSGDDDRVPIRGKE